MERVTSIGKHTFIYDIEHYYFLVTRATREIKVARELLSRKTALLLRRVLDCLTADSRELLQKSLIKKSVLPVRTQE